VVRSTPNSRTASHCAIRTVFSVHSMPDTWRCRRTRRS
jgi:hypothetical protein